MTRPPLAQGGGSSSALRSPDRAGARCVSRQRRTPGQGHLLRTDRARREWARCASAAL